MARLPRNSIRLSPQYPTPHRFVGYPNDYSYLIMLFSLVNSILSSIQTLIMFLAFRTLMAHFEPTETHVKYLAAPTDVSPYKMSITSGVVSIILGILAYHVIQVHRYRFKNLHDLKKRHGFTSDPSTYLNMTVEQAQEVYKNLAMNEFPFLFEFGWLINFFKVSGTMSYVLFFLCILRLGWLSQDTWDTPTNTGNRRTKMSQYAKDETC